MSIDGAVTIAVAALADLTMRRRNSGSSPAAIIGFESFRLEQPQIGERLAGDIHFPFLPILTIVLTLVVIISLWRWHQITQRDECQQHGNPLQQKWSETSFMDLKMMCGEFVLLGLGSLARPPRGFHFQLNRISGSSWSFMLGSISQWS